MYDISLIYEIEKELRSLGLERNESFVPNGNIYTIISEQNVVIIKFSLACEKNTLEVTAERIIKMVNDSHYKSKYEKDCQGVINSCCVRIYISD